MKNNPFLSDTFNSVWSEHFNRKRSPIKFKSFSDVRFVKSKFPYLYYNIGKNITNGMSYHINTEGKDHNGKVFLIYDVPTYFEIMSHDIPSLKLIKVPQYKGFLSDLRQHSSYDDFVKDQFKSNSRYKFRRNQERLETCFNIDYSIYHGHIEKSIYDTVMIGFKALLSKRFDALRKENYILMKWDYYYDLIYEMLLEKSAVLIVISNNNEPIGVSLSFLSDRIMFYAITSFDTDFYRFNLGHTTIIKLLNWCYDNGYEIYDFSKGEYEYKNRWMNTQYTYENHILYDSKSLIATLIAKLVSLKYRLKQSLRDHNFNEKYVKLKFFLRGNKEISKIDYRVETADMPEPSNNMQEIDLDSKDYSFLKSVIYDRLYKNPISVDELKVYFILIEGKATYFVSGTKQDYKIIVN